MLYCQCYICEHVYYLKNFEQARELKLSFFLPNISFHNQLSSIWTTMTMEGTVMHEYLRKYNN